MHPTGSWIRHIHSAEEGEYIHEAWDRIQVGITGVVKSVLGKSKGGRNIDKETKL